MQARWHVNHAGTEALWHVVGTQACMARDLVNSIFYTSS